MNKQRIVQLVVGLCVLIPAPFVFTGMVKEAQFTFGFTLITIFNLQRYFIWSAIEGHIKSMSARINVWLALMFCQVAFTINASIALSGSMMPGIGMCLGAIIVSQILHGFMTDESEKNNEESKL
jgi:hypothetical protein